MRRLPRVLLNILTTLSTLLCVGAIVLWVRSHRVGDVLSLTHNTLAAGELTQSTYAASAGRGVLRLSSYRLTHTGWIVDRRLEWAAGFPHERLGRHVRHVTDSSAVAATFVPEWPIVGGGFFHRVERRDVAAPSWRPQPELSPAVETHERRILWLRFPALVAATCVLPAVRITGALVRRRRDRHRKLRGLCPACGYDLRGTPGRCPECGTTPPSAAPHPATAVAAR